MNKLKIKLNKKGIILIEALIALTVIVIVMTALVTALISALNSTTFSNQQTVATALAQEGLDIARDQKNSDYVSFSNLNSGVNGYCLGENEIQIPGSDCSDIEGTYTRRIYINNNGEDNRTGVTTDAGDCDSGNIFVASIVAWNDSRCSSNSSCHEVVLTTCFINLNDLGT